MKPTEKQRKLFFDFCEFIDQNENFIYQQDDSDYDINYYPEIYIIESYLNNKMNSIFIFQYNSNNYEIISIYKRIFQNNKRFENEFTYNLTNKWIKFLRKKKLEKFF